MPVLNISYIGLALLVLSLILFSFSFVKMGYLFSSFMVWSGVLIYPIILMFRDFSYDSVAYIEAFNSGYQGWEYFFSSLQIICKNIGFTASEYMFLLSFIPVVLFVFAVKKFNFGAKTSLAILAIWLASTWSVSYSVNVIRQGISVMLMVSAISFFINDSSRNNKIIGFVLFLTAVFFHYAVVFLGLIYIFSKFVKFNFIQLVFFTIVLTVFSSSLQSQIDSIYFNPQILSEERSSPIPRFIAASIFMYIYNLHVNKFPVFKQNYYYSCIYKIVVLIYLCMAASLSMPEMFSRVHAYMWPFDCILIGLILKCSTFKMSIPSKIFLFSIFSIVNTTSIITYRLVGAF